MSQCPKAFGAEPGDRAADVVTRRVHINDALEARATAKARATTLAFAEDVVKASAPVETVTVKVHAPHRAVHEGSVYTGGDLIEVPVALADQWIKERWVSAVRAPRRPPSVKGEK